MKGNRSFLMGCLLRISAIKRATVIEILNNQDFSKLVGAASIATPSIAVSTDEAMDNRINMLHFTLLNSCDNFI